MSILKEFKSFVLRGNIIELAVAVIIGGAFGSIVSSLVDDIITPALLTPALHAAHVDNIAQLSWGTIKYGSFLSATIKFILIAFVLFMILKAMHTLKKKETVEAAAPADTKTDELLAEIRDLLKEKK
jgi:large conductance mechanosensitive channel